jgi:hypothetical protein
MLVFSFFRTVRLFLANFETLTPQRPSLFSQLNKLNKPNKLNKHSHPATPFFLFTLRALLYALCPQTRSDASCIRPCVVSRAPSVVRLAPSKSPRRQPVPLTSDGFYYGRIAD